MAVVQVIAGIILLYIGSIVIYGAFPIVGVGKKLKSDPIVSHLQSVKRFRSRGYYVFCILGVAVGLAIFGGGIYLVITTFI